MAKRNRGLALTSPIVPRTVIYIHGIGNKPKPSILKCQWDRALFGVPQHDRTRMAYWVNREYYPNPEEATCLQSDVVAETLAIPSPNQLVALKMSEGAGPGVAETIAALSAGDPDRARFLTEVAEYLHDHNPAPPSPADIGALGIAESVGDTVWRWLTEKVSESLLRDVHDFFFDPPRRAVMEQSLMQYLDTAAGPHVIVSHSQGTMIAYNVLRKLSKQQYQIPLFVTMGSPLGLPPVVAEFETRDFLDGGEFTIPECVGRWVNVSARFDIVCNVKELSGQFQKTGPVVVEDNLISNPDGVRNAHSGTGYLRSDPVQSAVRDVLGADFGQPANEFVIARDVEDQCHDAPTETRHSVLIQMGDVDDLAGAHARIEKVLTRIVTAAPAGMPWKDAVGFDPLRRFVSLKLTRHEIDRLRTSTLNDELRGFTADVKVWRNAEKTALIYQSLDTLQVRPAASAYAANGAVIQWAVVDSGVRADHPHFDKYDNVLTQWNCLDRGEPRLVWTVDGPIKGVVPQRLDPNGHGTHVAAIIAGAYEEALPFADQSRDVVMTGMAPQTKIHSYRVLDDAGRGDDAAIIKAIDHIALTNDRAGKLQIHGANLSLGGRFDPTMYGCGHSPLCQELRRLWRQGVVVVLAAGNSGQVRVLTGDNSLLELNTSVSIGDPANLGDAIAVGSVHKTNPHMNGISYFSSRGPTMDGRIKPDCVAPGERVLSARATFRTARKPTVEDLYVEMSGTSMAAPHVSGMLAAFLSIRREFIGYPDRVKRILLDNCTDLSRERYAQGRGLPNLVRMLVAT
jgi:subtilisin family serine protease